MKSTEIVESLAALAQTSRLAVYHLLVKRGPDGYTPGQLAAKLDIPAPTLSFHLKELQRVGLLLVRREGRNLYYTVNFEHMHGLVDYLTEKCCSLSDQDCDAACEPAAATARRKCA
jgi:DNA-binding transcriptional ArsR family regulator